MTDSVIEANSGDDVDPTQIAVGVVGLGLMGRSIVMALLLAGHKVIALAPQRSDYDKATAGFSNVLDECQNHGRLTQERSCYENRLHVTECYNDLVDCRLVIECVIEDITIKKNIYKAITAVVSPTTVIGTNTSAIPISLLQTFVEHPERFLGIHWAEPAYLTRFLEVICGDQTAIALAQWVANLAVHWGKEPTLLRRDIRGFITNRLMYAVYREIFHLIEQEGASYEALDKVARYDTGSWMTLMGVFRKADLDGANDFLHMLENLMPHLATTKQVPLIMQDVVATHKNGIYNGKGIYDYSPEEVKHWQERFGAFNEEINQLASDYSTKNIERLLKK